MVRHAYQKIKVGDEVTFKVFGGYETHRVVEKEGLGFLKLDNGKRVMARDVLAINGEAK